MSHYIVLVKQVPDVSQITDNAFDPKSGNLVRSRLPSVINELDAQAFALAAHLKANDPDPDSRLICLTMGPPMAREVLNYGLSRGADEGVLLTDPAMGGADTWATANPLAAAIRKLATTFSNTTSDCSTSDCSTSDCTKTGSSTNDFLIIAGMQSVDGDTAQVPAQIAEELDLPFVPYISGFRIQAGRPEFTRVIDHHLETLVPTSYPAVITVSDYPHLIFPTFAATRRARRLSPVTWSAQDIDATALGVPGSKTRVTRVFPPDKTQRRSQPLESIEALAQCLQTCLSTRREHNTTTGARIDYCLPSQRASLFDRRYESTARDVQDFAAIEAFLQNKGVQNPSDITPALRDEMIQSGAFSGTPRALDEMITGMNATTPTYQGDVWVMAEVTATGELHPATLELTGQARALADALAVQVCVVLLGESVRTLGARLIAAGADTVHIGEYPALSSFDPALYTDAVTQLYHTAPPQILMFSATEHGRALAPRVAYRTDCGLTADCTSLAIRDNSRKGEIATLMQTRPALGGNIMATIATKLSRTQMATIRPGIFSAPSLDPTRTGTQIEHTLTIDEARRSLRILATEPLPGTVLAPDADVVISGGKGLGSRDNFLNVLTLLTKAVERAYPGLQTQIGASRAAIEQGYIERAYQVGQTGRSVKPAVYLALGISGAIQHMIGLAHAETIIAINPDPEAPIISQCDYYLIDTAENVAAEISRLLNSAPVPSSVEGSPYAE